MAKGTQAKGKSGAAVKSAAKGSTALAKVEKGGAVTTAEAAKRMRDMSAQYHGKGGHGFEQRDLAIPFMMVLQAKSKPCVKSSEKYVEGAKEGMIYNSATNKLYDGEEGIISIPISYKRRWTQWKTRDSKGGGGFIKDWDTDEAGAMALVSHQDDKGRNIVEGEKDQQIVESGDFFFFVVDPKKGTFDRVMISMTSSNWKAAKRLNGLISSWEEDDGEGGTYNPAMFFRPYHLTTRPESNDQGDWVSWKVDTYQPENWDEDDGAFKTFDLPNGPVIVNSAQAFLESINKGEVKVAQPSEDVQEGADRGGNKKF